MNPLPPATQDIRDIAGPIAIPIWWHWPLAIATAAILSLGIILAIRWWRKRAHVLTPLEKAMRALGIAETHAREGRSHAWADVVAETIRGALAARLGVEILPQTTAELAKGAWTAPPLSEQLDAKTILELLEACDLARFAKASLDAKALLAATESARALTTNLYTPPKPKSPKPSKTSAPVNAAPVTS
jgi:hypothetical protein